MGSKAGIVQGVLSTSLPMGTMSILPVFLLLLSLSLVSHTSPVPSNGAAYDRDEEGRVCDQGWITWPKHSETPCNYRATKKLSAFLVSFLFGGIGADWFYLSGGSAGYIIAGIIKLLTGGGLGIWYLIDWIRVLADSFPDGSGAPLYDNM